MNNLILRARSIQFVSQLERVYTIILKFEIFKKVGHLGGKKNQPATKECIFGLFFLASIEILLFLFKRKSLLHSLYERHYIGGRNVYYNSMLASRNLVYQIIGTNLFRATKILSRSY